MMKTAKKIFCIFGNKSIKFYNNFTDRPTNNLLIHVQLFCTNDIINNFKLLLNTDTSIVSIICISASIRILHVPLYSIIKKKRLIENNYCTNPQLKLYKEFIQNDFLIDCKRHQLNKFEEKYYESNYNKNLIACWVLQIFLLTNHMRAISYLDGFGQINSTTFFFMVLSTFYGLKSTPNPYLINMGEIKLFYLSFSLGLFSLFWTTPMCYSYVSYTFAHIVINSIRIFALSLRVKQTNYHKYVQKKYRKDISKMIEHDTF